MLVFGTRRIIAEIIVGRPNTPSRTVTLDSHILSVLIARSGIAVVRTDVRVAVVTVGRLRSTEARTIISVLDGRFESIAGTVISVTGTVARAAVGIESAGIGLSRRLAACSRAMARRISIADSD